MLLGGFYLTTEGARSQASAAPPPPDLPVYDYLDLVLDYPILEGKTIVLITEVKCHSETDCFVARPFYIARRLEIDISGAPRADRRELILECHVESCAYRMQGRLENGRLVLETLTRWWRAKANEAASGEDDCVDDEDDCPGDETVGASPQSIGPGKIAETQAIILRIRP